MRQIKTFILLFVFVFGLCASVAAAENTSLPNANNGVIDLNGETYTLSSAYKLTTGEVTIKNGTITTNVTDVFDVDGSSTVLTLGENLIINATSSVIYAHNGGKLIVDGAKITGTNPDYSLAYAEGNNANITVKSGSSIISKTANKVTFVVDSGATGTIEGGIISNDASTTIVAKNGGVITVADGIIETTNPEPGYVAGYATNEGKIIINGGTVKAVYWLALSAIGANSGGIIEINGGTINKAVGSYEGKTSQLKITGGTMGDAASWGVYVNDNASCDITSGAFKGYVGKGSSGGTINLTGGVFSINPTSYLTLPNNAYVVGRENGCLVC